MAKKAAKKESSEKTSKAEKPTKKAKAAAPAEAASAKEAAAEAKPKKEKAAKAPKAAKVKKEDKNSALDGRWADLKEKHAKDKAAKYSMTGQFQANQAIEHPKLGWGFVLSNNNDRLEVIFQDGVKILISNFNNAPKI